MLEAATGHIVDAQGVQHGVVVLDEAAVGHRVDLHGAQRYQHLRGRLAALGAAHVLGEAAVLRLRAGQEGQRLIHGGLDRLVLAVIGCQRLNGHGGHVDVGNLLGLHHRPAAVGKLRGQNGLHQLIAGHIAGGGVVVGVQTGPLTLWLLM